MYPNASKNKATEQLLVGASISTNIGYESRLDALVSAQQAFDKTEADVNELKVTVKSLESLF